MVEVVRHQVTSYPKGYQHTTTIKVEMKVLHTGLLTIYI